MKKEEFDSKVNEMLSKIGEESSNLILDDVGILLNDNINMNDNLAKKDKEIEDLKRKNETLQKVNGNLLQQVAVGEDRKELPKPREKSIEDNGKPVINFKDSLDKNGNFII